MVAPQPVASYELKRFVSASDPQFAAALQIYVRNTPPSMRTDTNEITFWLERFTERFGSPFYVFGFYRNEILVGYAEAAYFPSQQLIMIDYLVIDAAHRGHNVFFEFVDHLRSYLERKHPEYRYAVAEVAYGAGRSAPSSEAVLRVRLLRLQGFQVVPVRYVQPRLSLDDIQSETSADLLVYSTESIDFMRGEAYLEIVRTIYYQYYLPWKSIISANRQPYRSYLDRLYKDIENSIPDRGTIRMMRSRPVRASPSIHRIVAFAAQALIVVALVTTGLLKLRSVFQLTDRTLISIFSLALVSFLSIAGIVSANARFVFHEIMGLAKLSLSRRGLAANRNLPIPVGPVARRKRNSSDTADQRTVDDFPNDESASA